MTLTILSLVVLVQVIVFQILVTLGVRTVLRNELEAVEGPEFDFVRSHANSAPRNRLLLGVLLGLLATVCALGLIPEPTTAKVVLAGISVVSAGAFAVASYHDRKILRAFVDLLPGGSTRRASLERRSLGMWYHPLFEAIPVLILLATALFLFGAGDTADGSGAAWLVALQAVFVFGAFFYSFHRGTRISSLVTRMPGLRHDPEAALKLSERFSAVEMRYFMAAKIGIAALLGCAAIESALEAAAHPAAAFWDTAGWILVGLLLLAFLLYLRKVTKVARLAKQILEAAEAETAR